MPIIDSICYHTVCTLHVLQSSHYCPVEVDKEGSSEEVISVLTQKGKAGIIHKDRRTKNILGRILSYTRKADARGQDAFQDLQTLQ